MEPEKTTNKPLTWWILPDWVVSNDDLDLYSKNIISIIEYYRKINTRCWITNEQFADLLNCSVSLIKRRIKILSDKGYIKCTTFQRNGACRVRILHLQSPGKQNNKKLPLLPNGERMKEDKEYLIERDGEDVWISPWDIKKDEINWIAQARHKMV